MNMKAALCVAYVQAVLLVGVASGRSHSLQHQRPDYLQHHRPDYLQHRHPGSLQHRHTDLLQPHGVNSNAKSQSLFAVGNPGDSGARGPDYLRRRGGSSNGKGGKVHVCSLCPASEAITPCMCQCLNETAAEILCGPELLSCSQLTEVMCLTTYPVNSYLRLVVQNTELGCKLEKDLWGPLMFQEIAITNNRFQVLDNGAFQPFGATLTALDLEGNLLKDVYLPTMNDTPLLRLLSLRNNVLEFLPGYSAMELALLETFDAAYNKITAIYAQTFAGMPKLQKIDLSNNAITKVSERAFSIPQHTASNLYINLAHNLISYLEEGMLEGVKVCSIDLQDNRLTTLPEKVFRPIIDFTAAAAVFGTSNNPFECGSDFCWIATNETVSNTFSVVLCPNLDNEPVDVLAPMCPVTTPATPTSSLRKRRRSYPGLSRRSPYSRKRKSLRAVRRLPKSPFPLP